MKTLSLCLAVFVVGIAAAEENLADAVYQVSPIGKIHNAKGEPVRLEVFEEFRDGLDGLEHCSHVTVLWWFHKNDTARKRRVLKVHPCGDKRNPLTGVFATHSPMRPNLIAMTICKVLSVKDGFVTIDEIDAFDGTPILDLKSAGKRGFSLKGKPPSVR